jgi:hypothetical protein
MSSKHLKIGRNLKMHACPLSCYGPQGLLLSSEPTYASVSETGTTSLSCEVNKPDAAFSPERRLRGCDKLDPFVAVYPFRLSIFDIAHQPRADRITLEALADA